MVEAPSVPVCERCGAETRLFGIEQHPTILEAELYTYVCDRCDSIQTEIVR